ncbi:autotransporter [Kitasatospora sp. NPDC006697]|uniref:autotransporter n=1 Tax=Kitasatospora sp. NPDC006697 TaxID=3364020 RepID=UPI003686B6AD
MKRVQRALLALAIVAGTTAVPVLLFPAGAVAASGDITSSVLANSDVVLDGGAVVNVPPGVHTYTGVISGKGSLRIAGTGTLVLTKDSTFTLPSPRQTVTVPGGNHPYVVVNSPDDPAVTVDAGATLQYGTGGTTGLIGAFPYNTPDYQQNQDNIRVDGTLNLSLTRGFNLGIISGSGTIIQPRGMWGALQLCGTNPFSGVLDIGTEAHFASTTCAADLPNARAVVNRGSWIIDTPLNQTVVQHQSFYSREYGNDVNVHSRPGSKVVLTGVYSYSDNTDDAAPALGNSGLNFQPVPHQLNKRGTNIEGADVQWGDGSTHQIFMPGTAQTAYVNLHARSQRSRLTFDYNGPVTLGLPIGGGQFHDTLSAPGAGDVVIAGTSGNDVTFAAAQFYDGSTTVQKGAVLRLGSGTAGGDGSLHTGGSFDRIVDDGSLVVRNLQTPTALPALSGAGALTQDGTATTTLTAASYTGATTVARGTLAVTGSSLAASGEVSLTGPSAALDLSAAATTALTRLDVVAGAKIIVPAGKPDLVVGGQHSTLSGTVLTVGGLTFALTQAGDRAELTAQTGGQTSSPTPAPVPTAAATTPAASPEARAEGKHAGTADWTLLGSAGGVLALLLLVVVSVRSRSARSARSSGNRSRPSRRRRARR